MSSFGGTVKLTGENEYRKALTSITNSLKELTSEMKLVSSSYGKNEDSIDSLNKKNDILKDKLKEQTKAVEEAKRMLNEAKTSTDSNSETVKKWQTTLNNAQAEVNKTSKEIKDNTTTIEKMEKANVSNTQELKEFEEAEKKAGESSLSLGDIIKGNLISDAIIGGIKALGSAVKSVARAFGEWSDMASNLEEQEQKFRTALKNTTDATEEDIQAYVKLAEAKEKNGVVSKSAILNGYQELATYTTQKESIEKLTDAMLDMTVQQYGMNASEEQTLSIATRLGKALSNGDYSGLAKMGYYFTDAEKQAMKFGTEEDRVNALLEAITGSVGGMNEALAQTDAGKMKIASSYIDDMKISMGQLFNDVRNNLMGEFLPEIQEMAETLQQMIGGDLSLEEGFSKMAEALQSGIEKIVEMLPGILQVGIQVITKLLEGIVNALPQIMPAVTQIILTLVNNLVAMLPQILQAGITIIVELANGLAQALPTLIPTIVDAIILMVETIIDNIDLIIDAGINIIMGLAEGLIEALPRLIDKIPVIIDKLITAITDNLPKIIEMGIKLTVELAVGLIKAIPQLVAKIPQIIASIVSGLANGVKEMASMGLNLVKGLWDGISNSLQWIKDKIKGWVGNVFSFIKKLFGISSPSKLFRDEIGTNLAKGIGIGFEEEMEDVNKDIANAIPTEFDTNVTTNFGSSATGGSLSNYDNMVNAFKEALQDVKVVMNGEQMGEFVTDTVTKVVYN